jgi:hypothetical protein
VLAGQTERGKQPPNYESKAMQANKQTATDNSTVKGWAREKAQAVAGTKAPRSQHQRIYDALYMLAQSGVTELSFDDANKATGLQRGARGDAVASWALALSKSRTIVGDHGWSVDRTAQVLRYIG